MNESTKTPYRAHGSTPYIAESPSYKSPLAAFDGGAHEQNP